jgi:hypothetical protein
LKIDKCPYTETFYPWIDHILFEKTQEGTKITASGEKFEVWTPEDVIMFVQKYNSNCKKQLHEVLESPGNSIYHQAKVFVDPIIKNILLTGEKQVFNFGDGTQIAFLAGRRVIDGEHHYPDRKYDHEIDNTGKVLKTSVINFRVDVTNKSKDEWKIAYQEIVNFNTGRINPSDENELSNLYREVANIFDKNRCDIKKESVHAQDGSER